MLIVLCGLFGCARNETYPARPIELICPWAAGGGTDRLARQVAHLLEQELDTPVNVINATGGNGVTGHTRGALAEPHGYTLTLATVELNMLHWRGLTSLGPQDFEPLCLLNRDDSAIFVRSDSPHQTINELETAIRNATSPLKASGTSQGGVWHVATIGWLASRGIPQNHVTWISIAGSVPSLQELLAGGVDFVCCSVAEAASLLDAGKVRCLGIMAEKPSPTATTFREVGIDWAMGGWRGIAAPKHLDVERKARLCVALDRIAHSEEFRTFMNQAGFNLSYADSTTFAAMLDDWDQEFGEILTSDAFRSSQQPRFGAMFFPTLIGTGLLIVTAALLATGGLKMSPTALPLTGPILFRLALVPAWVMAYLWLTPLAGFVVTVAGLLLASMLALRVRWQTALPVTLAVVPVVYHLFAVVLHVSLPWGWIGW